LKTGLSREKGIIIIPRMEIFGPKGSVPVDLILDTGAAYTLIGWDVAMALGYTPERHCKSIPIVTANGRIHAPLLNIQKISIQDAVARNVPAVCHDIPDLSVSGLLGLSFLKHFRTVIDYRSLTLQIE